MKMAVFPFLIRNSGSEQVRTFLALIVLLIMLVLEKKFGVETLKIMLDSTCS